MSISLTSWKFEEAFGIKLQNLYSAWSNPTLNLQLFQRIPENIGKKSNTEVDNVKNSQVNNINLKIDTKLSTMY